MDTLTGCVPDVMQVCRNGHVITDLLHTFPERGLGHCDRCGATTLDHCGTCGRPLPGAVFVPGLLTVGRSDAPQFCSTCGAAFPWTKRPSAVGSPLFVLENLLRRVPAVIRQLRSRHGEREPFRVDDEHDLADLLRSLLPLHFDDVSLESRTPTYSVDTRNDVLLRPESVVIVAKRTSAVIRAAQLSAQFNEDTAYFERERRGRTVVLFIYDPEAHLVDARQREQAWSAQREALEMRCIIAQ